jgi:hypothetical protein
VVILAVHGLGDRRLLEGIEPPPERLKLVALGMLLDKFDQLRFARRLALVCAAQCGQRFQLVNGFTLQGGGKGRYRVWLVLRVGHGNNPRTRVKKEQPQEFNGQTLSSKPIPTPPKIQLSNGASLRAAADKTCIPSSREALISSAAPTTA